ncbi:hypothetical protein RA8CHR_01178 [Variovorax sp. RA8]|nr:hypothetical protein RA8CHR_01178 [Variovorax sp. RA8]
MSRRCYAGDLDDDGAKTVIEALRKVIKRMHYPLEVMLVCVR